MGLFFNRKKNKKSKKKGDDEAVLDLDVLEPLNLTDAIEDAPKKEAPKAAAEAPAPKKAAEPEPAPVAKEPEPPVVPPVEIKSTGDPTRDAMALQFAELRRAVAQKKAEEASQAKAEVEDPAPVKTEDPVKEKARGIFARKKPAPEPVIEPEPEQTEMAEFVETEVEVSPNAVTFENVEQPAEELDAPVSPPRVGGRVRMQVDEDWLGLWVAEDGRAIVIEEGDPGDYFISAMPDPMSKCYTGPDYPEIETWRMPAEFVREPMGDIDGDRMTINTVPGLPEGHSAPTVYLYFLTRDEEDEDENRFARRGDGLRSIFMVTDSEPGSVNPWGNEDEVLWLGEPASFYKAPEKLDLYIDKRLRKGDPSNFSE